MNMKNTNDNFNKLYVDMKPELMKLYKNYKCLNLTEEQFVIMCKDLLIEIYNESENKNIEQNIEILKRSLNEYVIKEYINNQIKNSKLNIDNMKILKNLEEFFRINRIEQTPDLYESLLENSVINEIVSTIITNNLSEIKKIGLNSLCNNHNIIILLEMYCENNNIIYKPETLDIINNEYAENQSLDSLGLYLSEIPKKLLTKEDEQRLFKQKEQGDEKAINIIAEHNLLLVVHIAKEFVVRGQDILDLIQEGTLGLMTAINKFDYRKGYKFSTYATWWIRQSIQRSIMNNMRLIRLPIHMCEKINNCSEATRKLEKELERTPTKKEISDEMHLTIDQLYELEKVSQSIISINALIGDENESDTELGEFIAADEESIEEQYFKSTLSEEILHILDRIDLSTREKDIILERNGFNGKPKTLEEIAKELGLTRERVRQIEAKALRKIRTSPYIKRLAALTDISLEDNRYIREYTKRKTLK